MAEIALVILGPAIEVVKWVAAPIKRQFNYLCCFTSNIIDLQDEAENLDVAKGGLQGRVDRANDNVQPIRPEVQKWLKDYDDIIRTMTEITNDVPRVQSGCSKLISRYRLSRRAKKETAYLKEHREKCNFDNVALPAPPPAREALPTRTMYDLFKSRKHIEDGIMTALEGKDLNMIGLQKRVDHENDNVQPIFPEVQKWLEDYEGIKAEMARITDDVPRVETGCSKLVSRYRLSRRAKNETAYLKEHREKCKFSNVADTGPLPAREALPTGTMYDHFKSRKHIEDGIMTALEGKDFNMIGICGMGGAGKTTMAVEIVNKLREEDVFDEVVKVVISHQIDELKIQNEIAGSLGLNLEGKVPQSRVQKLRARLAHPRRVLVLLDNVWEKLALEELGIPCKNGSPGCKVLVTSRDTKVLAQMEMGKVFKLEELSDEESWILFRGKAGACVDGAELIPIAEGVMKQCGGLPIALAAVGEALKDVENIATWRNALRKLRNANPAGISKVIERVYKPLRLSYDLLGDENEDAKSLFLLCCLFPEDYNIPLELLTYCAIGLHLFKEVLELKEARDMTTALIETLRNRCLLLDGSDEDHVRMHNVVRDVSIFIAEEERKVKCNDCTWISSHVDGGARHVSREESCFPELKLLWMNNKVEQETESLIGGSTTGLNVLFIEDGLLKSLPLIISLTTLVLHDCDSLESIAVVGQLESLEILICHDCNSIKEFPKQVRGLKRLKLLEIVECEKLKRIAAGVISSMVALEELKIVDSFNDWKGGEIDEERNDEASLREIESLKKLRCLNIDVSDIALAAQPLRLSFDKLVQFAVRFGKLTYDNGERFQRRMYLHSRNKSDIIDFGDLSANIFLTRVECLSARAEYNQDFNLNLATVQNIRWLNLERFTNKKNITSAAVAAASFPLLEYLRLAGLHKLEEIWDDAPIPSNSFNNLKELRLVGLRALKRMGKCVLSTTNDFFLQLEVMQIEECTEMEHLLVLVPNVEEQDKEDHSTVLIFPKLETIVLYHLPKLTNLICSRGIESIQFPLLAEMSIAKCENLKWLVSRDDDGDHYKDDEDDSLHLFCNPKVSFPNLKKLDWRNVESKNVWCDKVPIAFFTGLVELRICYYGNIRRLFSSSSKIPQNLVNLQKLEIFRCSEMVKVIEDDEDVSSSSSCITPLFPSLQEIQLHNLPKLESFCEWRCAFEFPSLKILEIFECDEMKSFNTAAVITPSLQTVGINFQELECIDDLNAALLQHFQKAKRVRENSEDSEEEEEEEEEEEVLMQLQIDEGDEMKSFNAGAGSLIITPALQTVEIDDEELECVDDLNAALHQHFEKPKRHLFHETEEKKPKISEEDHHNDEEVYDVEKSLSHGERGELLSLEKKKPKIPVEDHHDGVYDMESPKDQTRGVPHEVPQRCIEHCNLFLPDCEFDKEKLVRMWIAEGCIELGVIKRMEDVGNLYFDALVQKEVIVPSKFDNVQRRMKYKFKKPDLVLLEQGQYLRINASNMDGIHKEVLHLTWQCKRLDRTLSDAMKDLTQLRTLVVHEEDCSASISQLPSDIFSGLTLLKTLDLSRTHLSELPGSIGKLESLQYLDVSETPIKQLPESLDRLYCLQTLNLRACVGITALPRGFGRLVNLRHLDLDIVSQLKFMPGGMGNLIELQTLRAFIVGKDDGCGIGELKKMNGITGSFCISRLENVNNAEEAKEAALCDKKYIDKLELRWRNSGNDNFQDYTEILESLQPHFGLKELQLTFYGGSKLPRWINNPAYTDLSSMTLYKCINCDTLPSIGELPSLKILSIYDMENVRNIDTVFCRNNENKVFNAFPMLEKLTLDSMPSLEEWTGVEDGDFARLRHVSIEYCPELRVLPSLAYLRSLEYFELSDCIKLISLPEGSLPSLLGSLIIRDCPGLNESCRKDEGVDWFKIVDRLKIAPASNIWIDQEKISLN